MLVNMVCVDFLVMIGLLNWVYLFCIMLLVFIIDLFCKLMNENVGV